jgi:hypothetical protein
MTAILKLGVLEHLKGDTKYQILTIFFKGYANTKKLKTSGSIMFDSYCLWYLMFFAKIPRGGVKGFRKNCLGGGGVPLFRVLLHFY